MRGPVRCRLRYGDLSVAPAFAVRSSSTAVGLECLHNLDVMAWMLLNGDLSFRPTCDFKELGVAKISLATTSTL